MVFGLHYLRNKREFLRLYVGESRILLYFCFAIK